ncbi:hypothetical protein BC938DRAFT_476807 [Jimgerdemannia flammicorona]|uniref:Uncharacterized protein n=1 Tax=Jimgerdemannia flammicorona TaxID=994334 RepID=A0A433QQ36_9FUNG|nr:hypothetical protein BC938DRAFT_476807 [Jimgerdemannia flammicorona]
MSQPITVLPNCSLHFVLGRAITSMLPPFLVHKLAFLHNSSLLPSLRPLSATLPLLLPSRPLQHQCRNQLSWQGAEFAIFSDLLTRAPARLSVILGPSSSGKTALVREILHKKVQEVSPLFINCHADVFDTPTVYRSLYAQFVPLHRLPGTQATIIRGIKSVARTSAQANLLLGAITETLPCSTEWNDTDIGTRARPRRG